MKWIFRRTRSQADDPSLPIPISPGVPLPPDRRLLPDHDDPLPGDREIPHELMRRVRRQRVIRGTFDGASEYQLGSDPSSRAAAELRRDAQNAMGSAMLSARAAAGKEITACYEASRPAYSNCIYPRVPPKK